MNALKPVAGSTLRFWRRMSDGSLILLGHATLTSGGWKFLPAVAGHKPSRKRHPTLERCLPRWVRYPDGCESEYVRINL